jgi:hypothetical protein
VLGALAVALSSTRQKRADLMVRLRTIEDLFVEQTQQQVVVEETAALITQIEIFEGIPLFGAATGALLNLAVAHKTQITARRLFQERWLRDYKKIDSIEPSIKPGKIPSVEGWSGALARATYSTLYGLTFGAAFPVCFLVEIARSAGRPLSRVSLEAKPNGKPRRRRTARLEPAGH